MKALSAMTCALLIGIFLLGLHTVSKTRSTQRQAGTQEEARQLWEQAMTAKGGRARLCAVRNMVVTHRGNKDVALYVFPNKIWQWTDDRETPIGLAVMMVNMDANLGYVTRSDDPQSPIKMDERWRRSMTYFLLYAQLYYLLETQWVKPVPVGVTSGRAGRRTVDVVQTLIDGTRVDFYLDRASHLPLKVAFPAADERGTYYVTFSAYADVAGIQMPQRVSFMGSGNLPTTYQLNVAYDEGIFARPPTIAAGAEAWRTARR